MAQPRAPELRTDLLSGDNCLNIKGPLEHLGLHLDSASKARRRHFEDCGGSMSVFPGGVPAFMPRPRAPGFREAGELPSCAQAGCGRGQGGDTSRPVRDVPGVPTCSAMAPHQESPGAGRLPRGSGSPGQGCSQTWPSAQQQRQWGPAREPPAWGGACTPPGRLHLLSRMPPQEATHGAGGDPVPSRGPPGVRLCTDCEEPQGAPSQPCAVRPGERPKGTGPATSWGGCQDRGEGTSAHGARGATIACKAGLERCPRRDLVTPRPAPCSPPRPRHTWAFFAPRVSEPSPFSVWLRLLP